MIDDLSEMGFAKEGYQSKREAERRLLVSVFPNLESKEAALSTRTRSGR